MPTLLVIALKIALKFAWVYLVPFLFELLSKKFGPEFTDFVYDLVGKQHVDILHGKIDAEEAENRNVLAIKELTKGSQGLTTTWAKFINLIVYMKWTQDNVSVKFDGWIDSLLLWDQKKAKYKKEDFMDIYKSRPDLLK